MDIKQEKSIKDGEDGDGNANPAPQLIRHSTPPVQEKFPSDIMVSNECIKLSDLPNWGGNLQQCYEEVEMPAKLYTGKKNIQQFTEEHLREPYQVEAAWHKWLSNAKMNELIAESTAVTQIALELRPQGKSGPIERAEINIATANNIFGAFDGKLKKDDKILSDEDRTCIHLLVHTKDFSKLTHQDLTLYAKEARCLESTLALINKYNKIGVVDIDLIRSHWPTRPNRRFTKISIFILQFFGRADRLFTQEAVSKLWHSLLFVHDFVLGLQYQASVWKDKGSAKMLGAYIDDLELFGDDSSLVPDEAVIVKSEKKRTNDAQKNANKSATKKPRSENTLDTVSTNLLALFNSF